MFRLTVTYMMIRPTPKRSLDDFDGPAEKPVAQTRRASATVRERQSACQHLQERLITS